MKTFLTAEWNNLILITYSVEPELLFSYLPKGLKLDTINGKAFVSLVAFEFNNVKVKGLGIPFHTHFPEINLRFYVKQNDKRGVIFIKEFVPKFFVSLIANKIYNEPYSTIPMSVKTTIINNKILSEHLLNNKYSISVSAENNTHTPDTNTIEHFFKEHSWGYGKNKQGEVLSYKVEHPIWEIYKKINYSLNIDFEFLYGKSWAFLNNKKPYNVVFAKGSTIKVFDKL